MIERIGWLLAVAAPLLAMYGVLYLPYVGAFILAGVAFGALAGFLIYEHIAHRGEVSSSAVWEQALLALIMLVALSVVMHPA